MEPALDRPHPALRLSSSLILLLLPATPNPPLPLESISAFAAEASAAPPLRRRFPAPPRVAFAAARAPPPTPPSPVLHSVHGVECREVTINLPPVGPVTVLEATAAAQELLVDAALALDDGSDGGPLSAGDPYGSVLWPAASAVASHLLGGGSLAGRTVLELGTGTGLVSIAAALGGAESVTATDYEVVPLRLLEYAEANLNRATSAAARPCAIETALLDICDHSTPLPPADLLVAADIMYEPKTGRAAARRAVEALWRGSRVVVGCSPGRQGRPAFLEELRRLVPGIRGAEFVGKLGRTCSGPRHDLICGEGSASVSDVPRELAVALMDLDPARCLPP